MSIFVSWRGSDREVKNRLVQALRTALPEEEVWESDEGCMINAYDEFIRKIRSSEIFIVIVSDAAMEPSYVFNEVLTARACEMAGTLNMLVYKITDSPYTPSFEANLNHLVDVNHVARRAGTDEGFDTLAQRVRKLLDLRRNGTPENPYDTFLPQLVGTELSRGYYVPHSRDDVFQSIDRAFAQSNAIIAAQISGYGRRCAVREYALRDPLYKKRIVLHSFSGSLRSFFTQGIQIANISQDVFRELPEREMILRKAQLLQKLDKDTLIIVPNFVPEEREDPFVYDALAMLGCRVVFISGPVSARVKQRLPVVCVDRMRDEHLQELFFHYYDATDEEQQTLAEPLTAFFDSIDGHTKSVELVANFLAEEFGVYPEDVPGILSNIRPDSENELSERIFSLLSELFDIKKFTQPERRILLAAALVARFPMDEKQFVKLLTDSECYDSQLLRTLVDRGWIDSDRGSRTLSVDGFFGQVCLAKIPPEPEFVEALSGALLELLTDQLADLSIGSAVLSVERIAAMCDGLGLDTAAEVCRKYTAVWENEGQDPLAGISLRELTAQVNEQISQRFSDTAGAALQLLLGTVLALMNAELNTSDLHRTTVADAVLSQVLEDNGFVRLLEESLEELEDPAQRRVFENLVRMARCADVDRLITAYELMVNMLCSDEDEQLPDAVLSVLSTLGEVMVLSVRGRNYLTLRLCRAWRQFVGRFGVLSFSRGYITNFSYIKVLVDLDLWDQEMEDACSLGLYLHEQAEKEGYFAKLSATDSRKAAAEELVSLLETQGTWQVKSGDPEAAVATLWQIAGLHHAGKLREEAAAQLCREILRQLIKTGDTQTAAALAEEFLGEFSAAGEDAMEEIRLLDEALHADPVDSFRDRAEEYLDYYRTYATASGNKRQYARYETIAQRAKALDYSARTREQLLALAQSLKQRAAAGEREDTLAPEAFALVSEAGMRTLGYRHHLVQYIGGMAMADGKIAEIQNGEGKTYTILLPAFLHFLYGRRVFIIDSSEYLTRRNYAWMRGVLQYLGCAPGLLDAEAGWDSGNSYSHYPVVYTTARDLLFAGMRRELDGVDPLDYDVAIIDEAEQLLVAEARQDYVRVDRQTVEDPLALAQAVYDTVAGLPEENRQAFFSVDPQTERITLKPLLLETLYAGETKPMPELQKYGNLAEDYLRWCVNAQYVMQRDRDYFIVDGMLRSEDSATGRFEDMAPIMVYFLSRKENLPFDRALLQRKRIHNRYCFREFAGNFRLLSGTTATASGMKEALVRCYGLEVVSVSPNVPVCREDHAPVLFVRQQDKLANIVGLVAQKQKTGQPVLVVTDSVSASREFSRALKKEGVAHTLLNAQNADQDAQILEKAGCLGVVTVTTALANRGVDIRLGGNPRFMARDHLLQAGFAPQAVEDALSGNLEACGDGGALCKKLEDLTAIYRQTTDADRKKINDLGGLCVIGTVCFDDLRTEQQMRGRCGRQGDRGESYVFFSVEDKSFRSLLGNGYEALMAMYRSLEVDWLELGSVPILLKAITSARKRYQNAIFQRLADMLCMHYRPKARARIMGLLAQLQAGSCTMEQALDREFVKNPYVLEQVFKGQTAEGHWQKALRPHLPKGLSRALPGRTTKALKQAWQDYRSSLAEEDSVRNLLSEVAAHRLKDAWQEYLHKMEKKEKELSGIYVQPKKLEWAVCRYADALCDQLLGDALGNAAITVIKRKS